MDAETRKRLETYVTECDQHALDWGNPSPDMFFGNAMRESANKSTQHAIDLRAALAEIDQMTKQWDSLPLVSGRYYELSLRSIGEFGSGVPAPRFYQREGSISFVARKTG